MAGLPKQVLIRAKEISKSLEKQNLKFEMNVEEEPVKQDNINIKNEVYNIIKDLDPNRISPMHAFEILVDLTSKVKEEK